ncbi:hypothetical protein MKJ04_04980 [Pontibacter sp. E15-1]|uniref:hypothetical protein n=1 Tax=Pontibacter sp. E15-1 TaxID=2919918 RepID=UPI001F4FCEF7|nr:hypothetical protein [Pontibacter sp. E15-1]MCJ8164186.1 hypothetical protein [Pontibacter sp. E15-1]
MEKRGTWTKDEEGYMTFDRPELQRLYETVTDSYHRVYNRYLEEEDDDDAYYKALADGYEMVTDYKTIDGNEEFVTSYTTPTHVADIWYGFDEYTSKRVYTSGFIRITDKAIAEE